MFNQNKVLLRGRKKYNIINNKEESNITMHSNYEMIYIINPNYQEEQIDAVIEKVEAILNKEDVKELHTDKIGRRELSVIFKKFDKGYFVMAEFNGNKSKIKNIETKMNLLEDIIRYMIVNKDK